MKNRLLSFLCAFSFLALVALAAAPLPAATTTTKSAIKIGNGSFALVKGTKLEVLGRDGDHLIVKFRATQGKIPLADTDFNPATALPEVTAAAPAPVKAPVALATPVTPAAAKPTPPPALSVDGKPTSAYGKAVQKAKQVEQAHKDKLVDPADEILGEKTKP